MRVFSVPVSAPFLRTVIAALVDGRLVDGFEARTDPARLAQATLYLPTLRAGRMAREIFLDELKTDAVVLPRIVALGDIDEDELAFAKATLGGIGRRWKFRRSWAGCSAGCAGATVAAWAKQISRDAVLAPLVIGGPASTLALAGDLARLMDDMVTRGSTGARSTGWCRISSTDTGSSRCSSSTSPRPHGPRISPKHGRIEPAARRDLLIEAEAARLTAHRDGPVIAAGSTGSMPSTAKLLHAVASLPQGAVVLPGLDTDLDDDAWQSIGGVRMPMAGSPRIRHRTIRNSRCTRCSIASASSVATSKFSVSRRRMAAKCWSPKRCGLPTPPRNGTGGWPSRRSSERFRPAWTISPSSRRANPEMEALAIAVAMREARHLKKSAALVTPDRALARRVAAALGRWNLEFDDSGGDALTETSAGIFARLAAEAAANGLEPPTLLALIKHPLCRLGGAHGAIQARIEVLEMALLRGTRPQAGSGGLARDFARFRQELAKLRNGETSSLHRAEPRAGLRDEELDLAQALIGRCRKALSPLESLGARSRMISPYSRNAIATSDGIRRDPHGVAIAFRRAGRARRWRPRSTICSAGRRKRADGRTRRLPGGIPDRLCRPYRAAAGIGAGAAPHLWPTGSAADAIRPRHSGRAGRRRVATGAARWIHG